MTGRGWLLTLALVALAGYLMFSSGLFMHGD